MPTIVCQPELKEFTAKVRSETSASEAFPEAETAQTSAAPEVESYERTVPFQHVASVRSPGKASSAYVAMLVIVLL